MDNAELIGGVLADSADPRMAARQLAGFLVQPKLDRAGVERSGLDAALVDVLRTRLHQEEAAIPALCQEAAAWVLGRRSATRSDPWELVASLPRGSSIPHRLRRLTGETLTQLIVQATTSLRLAAPFIDRTGMEFLSDALAGATSRGVRLEILTPTRSTLARTALLELRRTVDESGTSANLVVSTLRADAPWAHLKVLTSDGKMAYIGSANVTGAGMSGPNLELGVLVRGSSVQVVERVLDIYTQPR